MWHFLKSLLTPPNITCDCGNRIYWGGSNWIEHINECDACGKTVDEKTFWSIHKRAGDEVRKKSRERAGNIFRETMLGGSIDGSHPDDFK